MRDSEGGPGLFGILHVRGLRRAKSKPFLSLGRAIIVRNGEIIPMSREFTPETERQRLQLLVSENQPPWPHSWWSFVPLSTTRSQGLSHPHHTEGSLLELTGKAPSQTKECRAGLVWRTQEEGTWAAPKLPLWPPLRKEVQSEVGKGNSKGP